MTPFASLSLAQAAGEARSASNFSNSNLASSAAHRPIPAPEPDPEPNPSPDAVACSGCGSIDPKDWDMMFLAIQERLEDCVGDTMREISEPELSHQRPATRAVILECIQAMKQLQSALTAERADRQNVQTQSKPSQA